MNEMKHYLLKSLMLLAAIATSAGVSAYDFEAGGFYFNVLSEADGTVEVTYNKDKPYEFGIYDVPMRVTHDAREYTVVAVGDSAFYYNDNCGGILVLPDSVVKIGEMSFGLPYNGGGYGQVQFMVSTGNPAFVSIINSGLYSRDLKVLYQYQNSGNLFIPDSLEEIGSCALAGYFDSETLEFPNTLKKIGSYAFYQSSIKSLKIPDTVTEIGDYAFYATGLKDFTMPASLERIGRAAFYFTQITSALLSDTVKEIGDSAFCDCYGLVEARLPQRIEKLGSWAFSGCRELKSINLPETLTEIPDLAFCGTGFTSIEMPNTVTRIGAQAFWGTDISELNIPNSVTSIGRLAFGCMRKLKSVYVPSSVTHFDAAPFSYASLSYEQGYAPILTEIIVAPDNPAYTSIDGVLYDKDVTRLISCPAAKDTIVIPNTVRTIGEGALSGCYKLKYVALNPNILTIEDFAFDYCTGLERIEIPSSLTELPRYAFEYCRNVKVIDIPASVKKIGFRAFENQSFVERVYCHAPVPPELVDNDCFSVWPKTDVDLYVPKGSYELYSAHEQWGRFTIHELDFDFERGNMFYRNASGDDQTVSIVDYDRNHDFGETLAVPATVTRNGVTYTVVGIDDYALDNVGQGDSPTTAITVPATVTTIGAGAFCNSFYEAKLSSIEVDEANPSYVSVDGVVYTKDMACLVACPSARTEIDIPTTVTDIAEAAFAGCLGLESVELPSSVVTIGRGAFGYCTHLNNLEINGPVKEIGELAFLWTFEMKNLTLPASVEKIGSGAFNGSGIQTLYCQAMTPPEAADDTFMDATYRTATLIVPDGARGGYEVAEVWCNFLNIEESDFSGIDEAAARMDMTVTVEDGTLVVSGLPDDVQVGIYTVGGQLVYVGWNRAIDVPGKGVYIIRAGNSTAKIVI